MEDLWKKVDANNKPTMIKRLKIKSFQGHKSLDLKFDPRITTITGPSDIGKSSIIRSLYWILRNKPAGADFIRHGDKVSIGKLKVGKSVIERRRGKTKNSYKINDKEFKAFRNDVPPEIKSLVKVSDINFQHQHESPFWFSKSAGEVSRELNHIVDLSIIDETLSTLSRSVSRSKVEVELIKGRYDEAKEKKKDLSFVPEIKEDFTTIKKTKKLLVDTRDKALALERVLADTQKLSKAVKTQGEKREQALECLEAARALEQQSASARSLSKAVADYKVARLRAKSSRLLFNQKEKELHKNLKGKCPLCGRI